MTRGPKTTQVALRLENDLCDLADHIAKLIGERSLLPDVRPTRTAVLRAAVQRGLEGMKVDLDSSAPRPKSKR